MNISESTYLLHSRLYLEPTIYKVWQDFPSHQEDWHLGVMDVRTVPDIRPNMVLTQQWNCDLTRYSTYSWFRATRLEEALNHHMELEGLKCTIQLLWQNDLVPSVIISDRHVSIQKWIHENLPNTTHYYDVWHVA